MSGFRYCGAYPLNRDAQKSKSAPAKFDPLSINFKNLHIRALHAGVETP